MAWKKAPPLPIFKEPEGSPIRTATVADLKFIDMLQKRWAKNIGYLPLGALERAAESRRIWLIHENDDDAGYMLFYPAGNGVLRINQLAIHPDLLRTTLGTQMMVRIMKVAHKVDASMIRLASREDLRANQFWPTLGLKKSGYFRAARPGSAIIYEWSRIIPPRIKFSMK